MAGKMAALIQTGPHYLLESGPGIPARFGPSRLKPGEFSRQFSRQEACSIGCICQPFPLFGHQNPHIWIVRRQSCLAAFSCGFATSAGFGRGHDAPPASMRRERDRVSLSPAPHGPHRRWFEHTRKGSGVESIYFSINANWSKNRNYTGCLIQTGPLPEIRGA
jgi:hypothetical protein